MDRPPGLNADKIRAHFDDFEGTCLFPGYSSQMRSTEMRSRKRLRKSNWNKSSRFFNQHVKGHLSAICTTLSSAERDHVRDAAIAQIRERLDEVCTLEEKVSECRLRASVDKATARTMLATMAISGKAFKVL